MRITDTDFSVFALFCETAGNDYLFICGFIWFYFFGCRISCIRGIWIVLGMGVLWVFRFGLFGDCDSRFGVMVVICCLICIVLWMLDVGFCVLGFLGSLVILLSLSLSALIVCNLWELGLYHLCVCVLFLTISSIVTF